MAPSVKNQNTEREFLPSPPPTGFDVIIGRGRKFFKHVGNDRLRQLVASKLDMYNAAKSKVDKSLILLDVVDEIRQFGDFVKQDQDTLVWTKAGDYLAREKTSQEFRNALCDKYKSSREAKKLKRRVEEQEEEKPVNRRQRKNSDEPRPISPELSGKSSQISHHREVKEGCERVSQDLDVSILSVLTSPSFVMTLEDDFDPFEPVALFENSSVVSETEDDDKMLFGDGDFSNLHFNDPFANSTDSQACW